MSVFRGVCLSFVLSGCVASFEERNFPPSITITSPQENAVFSQGNDVQLLAQVSDGEDESAGLTVRVQSSKSGLLLEAYPDSAGLFDASSSELEPGEHTLTLTVEDSAGLFTSDSIRIRINSLPDTPVIYLGPDLPTTADDLQVQLIEASDPDGDDVSVSFAWYKNGVLVEGESSSVLPSSLTAKGEIWTVHVAANDGQIDSEAAIGSIEIVDTPPTVDSITIDPDGDNRTNSTLNCSATYSDIDQADVAGLQVSYRWASLSQGFYSELELEGSELILDSTLVQPDDKVYCVVTVTDSSGVSVESSTYTRIYNTPPVFNTHEILATDGVVPGQSLTCYVAYDDADGSSIEESLLWLRNGDLIELGETLNLTTTNVSEGDTISCRVDLQDEHGSSATSEATVTVENSPPVMTSVGLSPTPAYAAGELTCTAQASDVDTNDTLTYTYAWEVNGVLQSETSNVADISRQLGDVVTCRVTPFDGQANGSSMESSITVQNQPPVINSLTLTPTDVYTNGTISASVAASDLDNDLFSIEYRWYVDGNLVQEGIQNSLDGSAATTLVGLNTSNTLFDKNQVVTVVAFATDDSGTGDPVSETVTILNTPPVIDSQTLSPELLYTEDSVTVTVSGSDVDGDTVTYTYEWVIDGTPIPFYQDTLESHMYLKDSIVLSHVTPFDGQDSGVPSITETLVLNTPPVVPGAMILPQPVVYPNTVEMVCEPLEMPYDIDEDQLFVEIIWFRNGEHHAEPVFTSNYEGDTIPPEFVEEGDEWSCMIVASDEIDVVESPLTSVVATCDGAYGTVPYCPEESCLHVLTRDPNATDGVYWLGANYAEASEAYCDMTTDGGGWTLVMRLDSDTDIFGYTSSYWEDDVLLNESLLEPNDSASGENAKFASFLTVPSEEMRLQFTTPESSILFEQMNGQTAFELFSGPGFAIVEDSDATDCTSYLETDPIFDIDNMLLPAGRELFGIKKGLVQPQAYALRTRFGLIAVNVDENDATNFESSAIGVGLLFGIPSNTGGGGMFNIESSVDWIQKDCDLNCGCVGQGTEVSKTSANLWVR